MSVKEIVFFAGTVLWPVFIIREVKIGIAAAAVTALVRLFIEAVNTQKPLEEGGKNLQFYYRFPVSTRAGQMR